ncbi:MAG: hypothetical protein IJJ55_07220 [Clostridia bacterium]|nr:hypothetical protein [Clostridia bacterium]
MIWVEMMDVNMVMMTAIKMDMIMDMMMQKMNLTKALIMNHHMTMTIG